MTNIVHLHKDYNGDHINDYAHIDGQNVEIVTGSHKMNPYVGETLFSGTLDQLKDNAKFAGAYTTILNTNTDKTKEYKTIPSTAAPSKTLRQDKGLDGNIYGGDN